MNSPPILVYLVTEDWYFLSHRLPMALAAQRAGYEVHVATHVVSDGPAIKSYGFQLHPLNWKRGNMNPLAVLAIIREVRRLYRELEPDLIHHVALQPAIIGSLASLGLEVVCLNALAGLGFVFTSRTLRARSTAAVIRTLIRGLMNRPRHAVLVQNGDDRLVMERLGIGADRIFLIPGSGVDTELVKPLPEPAEPMTAAFVGRLLDDKGVRTLVVAHEILAGRGRPIRLLIAGEPDPANPASIPPAEIENWSRRTGIELLGQVDDIREVWKRAHIAVLPSRREGLPKSLLEAAACGRAIVATDVPGCREIARQRYNALLVPTDNPVALADAIDLLAQDAGIRRRFGVAGRRLVETEFSAARVGQETVALYDSLLSAAAPLHARVARG
ncbi:MAG: glycosyltransferase family 4 protein [Pseudolabrys sp.]